MKKRILVRVDGSKEIGLGHVYNMLTVLNNFKNDNLLVVMNHKKNLGYSKFKKSHIKVKFFKNKSQLEKILKSFKPNIIFNDTLNTTFSYTLLLKKYSTLLVNFEDIGSGRKNADLIFNPIYYSNNTKQEFFGHQFACVRNEFRKNSKYYLRKNVKQIAITFGGTDPTNKTFYVLQTLMKLNLLNVTINVILGIGYSKKIELKKLIDKMSKNGFKINLVEKSDNISEFLRHSDFVITSNGRTVFEIAAMKIPMIAIAVNKRERTHSFVARTKCGFQLNSSSSQIFKKLDSYILKISEKNQRQKFVKNLEKHNLLNGLPLVVSIINQKYSQKTN